MTKSTRTPASQIPLLTYEVPEAGAMVGLNRNASYEAAKRGEIPTVNFGKLKRVPRAAWHRKLQADGCALPDSPEAAVDPEA